MGSNLFLDDDKFWKGISFLTELENEISVTDACLELEVSEEMLFHYVHFIKQVNFGLNIVDNGDSVMLVPPKDKPVINVNFTLSEWLAFQAHFPLLEAYAGKPFHIQLRHKLALMEQRHKSYDLFDSGRVFEMLKQNQSKGLVEIIEGEEVAFEKVADKLEFSIIDKSIVNLTFQNSKRISVFPHRLVHIEGGLSLIGEEVKDRTLVCIAVSEITSVDISLTDKYRPVFTMIELDDFITSLREINENEVRLVLKVHNPENFNNSPPHHFLRNPYVVTNPEGDTIWAASVEACEDLFDWILEHGETIEILDPHDFKMQYLEYCENLLEDEQKKVA